MKLTAIALTALVTLAHLATGDPAATATLASEVSCITCWPGPGFE